MLPAALHASRVAPPGGPRHHAALAGVCHRAVALSVMLIVSAITLARGFADLNRIDPASAAMAC
jgi:hypothetical protein